MWYRWIQLKCWLIGRLSLLALPWLRLHLRRYDPRRDRFYFIIDKLAVEAYRQGRWGETRSLALEGLELAQHYPTDWNYGNVIHDAHQLLGLLCLKENDVEGAVEHLIEAGNSPGSPQLDSFGPRMALARELVKRGERQPVLHYLDLVARFWAADQSPRDYEREQARKGKPIRYPWWMRWANDPRYLASERAGQEQKRQLIRYWKAEVKAGRVPVHAQWANDR